MLRGISLLLVFICLTSWAEKRQAVPGEYLVKLKTSIVASQNLFAEVEVKRKVSDRTYLIKTENAAAFVSSDSSIEIIEPNYLYYTDAVPNDKNLSSLWALKNRNGADLNTVKAWDLTTGSKSVVVAVIDSGVDATHPDLKDNMWVNLKEKNGKKGVDDDGNGYIDDLNGFDFVDNDGVINDAVEHGTHVAGTIGARGNNKIGVVGVNWVSSIMALKIGDRRGVTLAAAVSAIEYAVNNGAHVINASWGGPNVSKLLEEAIEKTEKAGIVFVAAAGNERGNNDRRAKYPANYDIDNIISVAAIDRSGRLASYSNYGLTTVDVAAPGSNIYSTRPRNRYQHLSGTSMAAPQVAGVVALMLAHKPNLTYSEIKKTLIDSSKSMNRMRQLIVSGGIVDAYKAVK